MAGGTNMIAAAAAITITAIGMDILIKTKRPASAGLFFT